MLLKMATLSTSDSMCSRERYHLIDALRGLSVVLMLGYHFGVTLIFQGLAPEGLIYNPLLDFLEPVFAGLFILISGMAGRFSRGNVRRGLIVLACAMGVTAVSLLPFINLNIWFGILHFLGLSMLIYGLFSKPLNKIPLSLGAPVFLALFIAGYIIFPVKTEGGNLLYWLGFGGSNFLSGDYFPFLKWFPLFLLGSQIGSPVKEHRLPRWFYSFNMPFLPFVGRHALIVYLFHQPVFYGFTALLLLFL